ncbi:MULTISPECIES: ExbD/TolR family protein [Hymenobacter]|nr:biopolymer transporter ExbD [Hymenobacter sp. 5414T-23]
MTPMVGIGFLLAFFCTLIAAPREIPVLSIGISRPFQSIFGASEHWYTMTIVLGKNRQVYYYDGQLNADSKPQIHSGILDLAELRKAVQKHDPTTIFLIKPSDEAKYQDMIDVLDEMVIADRKKFSLADIIVADYELLKSNKY